MKVKKIWLLLFLAPATALFLLVYAAPLSMVLGTSLTNYRLSSREIRFAGLANYFRMFQDPDFYTAMGNTLVWMLIHCIAHVALGVIIALLLYKKPRGWKLIRTVYMIPNIISNAAIAMIFVNIYNPQFGVLNSVLRLLGLESLTANWLMNPLTAFPAVTLTWFIFAGYTATIVLAQAISIDESMIEAARVDGASNFQVDCLIMLPMLKRIIGTTMVMAATYMLQMFDLIYITTNGGPGKMTTNLPLLLYGVYRSEYNYAYANTLGVCIIVTGALAMIIINRVFQVNRDD
jgi:raffinose/stachyose/melibiose transport system permease protein